MFKKLFFYTMVAAAAALAADHPAAHVIGAAGPDGGSQLGKLNLTDGSFFLIRNYEPTFWGMSRSGDFFYAVDGNGMVYKIDVETGAPTTVGSTGVPTSGPYDVSFNTAGALSTGEFYGLDTGANLWSIDLETGKARMVGNTGLPRVTSPAFGASLAGDDKNLYLTLEISDEHGGVIQAPTLFTIDPATAIATKIGNVPPFIVGSAVVNGKLYALTVKLDDDGNLAGTGKTQEINLQTGDAKALAMPAPCMGPGFGGFAAPVVKPMPPAAVVETKPIRTGMKSGADCVRCAGNRF